MPSFSETHSRGLRLRAACAFAALAALCAGCVTSRGGRGGEAGPEDYDGGLGSLFGGLLPPVAARPQAGDGADAAVADPEVAAVAAHANPVASVPAETADSEAPAQAAPDAEGAVGEAAEAGSTAAAGDGWVIESAADASSGGSFEIPKGVVPILGEDGEPVLRTGLTISVMVTVSEKVEVPTQVRLISPENTVMLPFVGVVSCEGMTLKQFRAHLTELYGDYLQSPTVSAEFVTTGDAESPWGKVRVMGHVGREGWINIPATRDLSLLSAIQRAGGVSKGAKRTNVRITRNLPDGTKKIFWADLNKLGKQGDEAQDIPLEPGDTVWVEERIW